MVAFPAAQRADGALRPPPCAPQERHLERGLQPRARRAAGVADARADPCLAEPAARQILSAADAPPLLPLSLCDQGGLVVRALWPRAAGRDRPPRLPAPQGHHFPRRAAAGDAGEHPAVHRPLRAIASTPERDSRAALPPC